jgi:hypothetical protein
MVLLIFGTKSILFVEVFILKHVDFIKPNEFIANKLALK